MDDFSMVEKEKKIMAIIVFDEKRFTDVAKETMDHMMYYVNESEPVTLLSERCAIIVHSKSSERDEIMKASDRQAREVAYSMPDFAKYIMDDDCGTVWLTNGDALVFISKESISGEVEVPLEMALEYRSMGLEACENNEVIAMFVPEKIC